MERLVRHTILWWFCSRKERVCDAKEREVGVVLVLENERMTTKARGDQKANDHVFECYCFACDLCNRSQPNIRYYVFLSPLREEIRLVI